MNQGVVHSSVPVQQMVAATTPTWWSINNMKPPSHNQQHSFLAAPPHNYFPGHHHLISSASWNDHSSLQEPESWSQLLLGGSVGEVDKPGLSHKRIENWEQQFLNQSSNSSVVDVIKLDNSANNYTNCWSQSHQMLSASSASPKSCVTTLSSNLLDFTQSQKSPDPQLPDPSISECNSTSTGGVAKKARIQSSSAHQSTFKVRKEKLGDRITVLHQLVSPFGKTDTASVLLEAIGYIRFLQSQVEALSLPYLQGTGTRNNISQPHQVQGNRNNRLFPQFPVKELSEEDEEEEEEQEEEEARAQVDIWKYVFGFTPMAAVKCAIELQIPEVLETNGGSISLSDLSTILGCSPSAVFRIMRYLMHHGFFKQTNRGSQESSKIHYAQTPLSRLLLKDGENSLAALILFESSPVMLAPWHSLSAHALTNGTSPFEAAHGENIWEYAAANPVHSKLINDAMACHARTFMSTIIDQCPEVFKGIGSLVDVGGGDGTTLHTLVRTCPHIRGINFDLPHVVSVAPHLEGIEHVGGDMFENVPKADAAFLMWVLHDWSDDECIRILRNCREAIPKDTGKVIIAEAVINEGEEDNYSEVRLALDMVMMAHTEKGKERTYKEWEYVLTASGFTRFKENHIEATVSVIEAYP